MVGTGVVIAGIALLLAISLVLKRRRGGESDECFSTGRGKRHNNYPNVEKSVPEENKRYINLENGRDTEIDRTEVLVSATTKTGAPLDTGTPTSIRL
jgi:hypothetical protein